jgi:phospholipase C
MPGPDRSQALDHVVVVLFENRSFDNLLGRLYEPGEVAAFEGVLGKELSNPIPPWAEDGASRGHVPYGVAPDMNTPDPDPGEEYQHLNTQLFGVIDPPGNRGVLAEKMAAPYNAPADPGRVPKMDGFVADYISAFTAEMGRQPGYGEYAQIMTGYTPAQMPVLSALARGFATFDHWFCEVPSQTFTNRSFFPAGTSSGYLVNMSPIDSFPVHNTAETIFDRLEAHGLTWRVYCSPPARMPFTGLIHAARLRDRFANFYSTDRFLEDAANGTLPNYSFIEPALVYGHNDMHPPEDALFPGLTFDLPSSLLGGEALLAQLYNAIRSSSSPAGSNAYNTLFLVSFDEAAAPTTTSRPRRRRRPTRLCPRASTGSGSTAPASASPPSLSRRGSPNAPSSTASTAAPRSSTRCASAGRSANRSPPGKRSPPTCVPSCRWRPRATPRTGPTSTPSQSLSSARPWSRLDCRCAAWPGLCSSPSSGSARESGRPCPTSAPTPPSPEPKGSA